MCQAELILCDKCEIAFYSILRNISRSDCHCDFKLDSKNMSAKKKSLIDQLQIMMRGNVILTADRA